MYVKLFLEILQGLGEKKADGSTEFKGKWELEEIQERWDQGNIRDENQTQD